MQDMTWDTNKLRNRFASYQVKGDKECVVWKGALSYKGYGAFKIGANVYPAHRVAWMLKYGYIESSVHVLHKCDNPACINIDHLFLGTNATNCFDRAMKGRTRQKRKLHICEVEEIRRLLCTEQIAVGILGRMFGVSKTHIYRIGKGLVWNSPYAGQVQNYAMSDRPQS